MSFINTPFVDAAGLAKTAASVAGWANETVNNAKVAIAKIGEKNASKAADKAHEDFEKAKSEALGYEVIAQVAEDDARRKEAQATLEIAKASKPPANSLEQAVWQAWATKVTKDMTFPSKGSRKR